MLLLQVMMVAIFKLIYMIFVSQDTINVTLASHDGRQTQGQKGQFCEYQDIIYVTIANEYGCHIQDAK